MTRFGQLGAAFLGALLALGLRSAPARGQDPAVQPTDSVAVPGGLYDLELITVAGSFHRSETAVAVEPTGSEYQLTTTVVGVSTSFNRFVLPHIAFGGGLGYSEFIQRTSLGGSYRSSEFSFGPRIARYWGARDDRLWPYAAAEAIFLAAHHDDARKPVLGAKVGGGIVCRPWPGFGIVLDASFWQTTLRSDGGMFAIELGLAGIID